ncbi:hypothetical protein PUN4_520123 [Paraburkholderia unamae]|uniref:hypothetical protein n=1 Tax=Paraburkholderia unamae TaxID=219649 RepID=UPI001CAB2C4D|nr:hypothetical protein [Paraburkholderia unamae]CAG9266768.1 hypothetical protein PUN4_520123 [Paraburkholderia unamae]
MVTQDRNFNAAQQGANAITEGFRHAVVSAFASPRDYGVELSSHFGDGAVELVNFRVQGKA